MATPIEVEFLKALSCVAWADGEVAAGELNFIKEFGRRFNLSGDDWAQVEMYLVEKVQVDEMKQIIRRFLRRARRSGQRKMLLKAVEELVQKDEVHEDEVAWLRDLKDVMAECKSSAYYLDGLKSLLRIGSQRSDGHPGGREANFHDFIHNRVLFTLRHRLGVQRLEKEGSPAKLKKLTLSAALMARVGYVDDDFLPQEREFMKEAIHRVWGATLPTAEAVSDIALETVRQGVDLHRLVQEAKGTMTGPERHCLVEGIFALSKAEGKTSNAEIEEIRKISYMLDFSHKQFIDAKLKMLKP